MAWRFKDLARCLGLLGVGKLLKSRVRIKDTTINSMWIGGSMYFFVLKEY